MSNMTARLSIPVFSRATYLSVKTLRDYHVVGPLEPAHIDPRSVTRLADVENVRPAGQSNRVAGVTRTARRRDRDGVAG